ncbi:MAG TPA: TonB-dependent receptor [Vicinamibacteria bacterium]|nr:TonB-dependent receptor [Vicinamibacteria bacterium]
MRNRTAAIPFTIMAPFVLAQSAGMATLRGRVLDPQGIPVDGARVVLRQTATGLEREVSAEQRGSFVLSDLPPGAYMLRVQASGFAEKTYPLVLQVGQNAEVAPRLEAAMRTESVEVSGETLDVQDVASVVSGVLTTSAIERLPLNGRNFLELSFLVPGNAPAPNFDPTKTNSVVVSSAGQLGRGGNIMIDGVDNNDDAVGGPLQNLPQDAVQEFRIATNRFSAEIGRSAGSAIDVVTRSGSDTWTGSAAVFLRDDALQGTPATYVGDDAPPFSRKQYALSGGGPLVRGRLFGFAAAEYRDQDGAVLVGERDVATQTIARSFVEAPLDDLLGTLRLDFTPSANDRFSLRYSMERATDTGASTLERSIGSASQRQESRNRYHTILGSWTRLLGSRRANSVDVSWSRFRNAIAPVAPGIQFTYPSLQDGASFRVPQKTDHDRIQLSDTFSWALGSHALRLGGELQLVDTAFHLGVFREGRIEFVQDFPGFDANGDGLVSDDDLLFAVTLRSAFPGRDLELLDCDNTHLAFFVQDDWRVHPQLALNLGLRYELDTDVKNLSGYDAINPLARPFLNGERKRDTNNFGPRLGFNWTSRGGRFAIHGGYGIYFDRVTLEIMSLERGLDGRALPVEVRAGNVFFLDPATGRLPPFAPSLSNPFTGFQLPGAGASGINIIDNGLENPTVQQFNVGFEARPWEGFVVRVDGIHDRGTHFIIGRPVGTVFNPVVGGPDTILNLESSVGTKYDALLVSAEKRVGTRHWMRAAYTLAKAFNYANDDQIPFSGGPIDPNDLQREYGPTPNDQRHRLSLAGSFSLPWQLRIAPLLTLASAVPMDILMPSGASRVPTIQRNAGGRRFKTAAELNAYLSDLNASGGVDGVSLPLVGDDARFGDSFQSLDVRLSRPFSLGARRSLEAFVECFNLWNATNILGVSTRNYSGFSNVLVRDSEDPGEPGYLRSSSFGKAVTTAGGVFGSGGPRAFQLGLRLSL